MHMCMYANLWKFIKQTNCFCYCIREEEKIKITHLKKEKCLNLSQFYDKN